MNKSMPLFIVAIITAFLITGCSAKSTRVTTHTDGTVVEEKFTNEASFNEVQKSVLSAHNSLVKAPPVIASFTTKDGSVVNIHSQVIPDYPIIRQPANPIVDTIKTVVNSTPLAIVAGGWSAKQLLRNATGDVNASGNAQVTTTSNSNNATDIRNADGDVSEDNSDNSDSSDNSNHSDNSDNSDNSVVDSHDQTAEPTIVEQPDYNYPLIVRPEVVYPQTAE